MKFKPSKISLAVCLLVILAFFAISYVVGMFPDRIPPSSRLIGIPFGFLPVGGCGIIGTEIVCDPTPAFDYTNLAVDLVIWGLVGYAIAIGIQTRIS